MVSRVPENVRLWPILMGAKRVARVQRFCNTQFVRILSSLYVRYIPAAMPALRELRLVYQDATTAQLQPLSVLTTLRKFYLECHELKISNSDSKSVWTLPLTTNLTSLGLVTFESPHVIVSWPGGWRSLYSLVLAGDMLPMIDGQEFPVLRSVHLTTRPDDPSRSRRTRAAYQILSMASETIECVFIHNVTDEIFRLVKAMPRLKTFKPNGVFVVCNDDAAEGETKNKNKLTRVAVTSPDIEIKAYCYVDWNLPRAVLENFGSIAKAFTINMHPSAAQYRNLGGEWTTDTYHLLRGRILAHEEKVTKYAAYFGRNDPPQAADIGWARFDLDHQVEIVDEAAAANDDYVADDADRAFVDTRPDDEISVHGGSDDDDDDA
jgi:hypothetical protein